MGLPGELEHPEPCWCWAGSLLLWAGWLKYFLQWNFSYFGCRPGCFRRVCVYVVLCFFLSIPRMVLMHEGCEHHESVYFNWLCYPDKLKAESWAARGDCGWGFCLFSYWCLTMAGLLENTAKLTSSGFWHAPSGWTAWGRGCSAVSTLTDLCRAPQCCIHINGMQGRFSCPLPLSRMVAFSPVPFFWSILHNDQVANASAHWLLFNGHFLIQGNLWWVFPSYERLKEQCWKNQPTLFWI